MIIRLAFILSFLVSIFQVSEAMSDIPEKDVLKSISNGQTEMLKSYLDAGGAIDALYDDGKTTLLNYAVREQNMKAVQLLIERGADINLSSKGKTPLINAVIKNDMRMLHFLLNSGADMSATVNKGNTALILASKSGRIDCVRMLVEHGADVEYKNTKGLTALDYANMANYVEVAEYLVKIIEMRNYYTDLPNYSDGPHIDWVDDTTVSMFYMIYDTTINYPIKKEDFFTINSDRVSLKGFAGDSKDYTIQKHFDADPTVYRDISKVLAIGDIHGHYGALAEYLKINKIIDYDLNWIWGDGHVVFLGDVFDRGNEVTESLWFIYKLDMQAREKGGRVHMLLGNHEVMVMSNDTRYLNRKYELFSNYFTRDYADFFNMNSVLGHWLRTRNTIIKINGNIFSHAGISPAILNRKLSIHSINVVLREYLAGDPRRPLPNADLAKLVLNEEGPLWFRGYVLDGFGGGDHVTDKQVTSILDYYKAEKMIIAHTEVKKMSALFDGKIIAIDVAIRTEFAIPEALLIKNGEYFRLTSKHEEIPCAFNDLKETP